MSTFENYTLDSRWRSLVLSMGKGPGAIPIINSSGQVKVILDLYRNPKGLSEAELKLKTGARGNVSDWIWMLQKNGWQIEKQDGKYRISDEFHAKLTGMLKGV